MGAAWTIVFRDHDAAHNDARRMLRKGLGPNAIPQYRALIESAAHKFLGEVANQTLDISEVMQPWVVSLLPIFFFLPFMSQARGTH